MPLTAYVASPLGFSATTASWYNDVLLPALSGVVTVNDPWSVNIDHILATPTEERGPLWRQLGSHHFATIAGSDLVVAVLEQEPPDVGTVAELGYAHGLGKPVFGLRLDVRTSGEAGMPYNLMLAAAICDSGGVECSTVEELVAALRRHAAAG